MENVKLPPDGVVQTGGSLIEIYGETVKPKLYLLRYTHHIKIYYDIKSMS